MTQIDHLLNVSALQHDEQAISPVRTISQGIVPSRIEYHSSSSFSSSSSSHHHRRLYNIVICGTVRNVQPHLIHIRESIRQLMHPSWFHLSHLLFVEHNSTDTTVQELQSWNQFFDCNVTIYSEVSYEPERTVRLAQARNRLWNEISHLSSSSSSSSTIDFVLMMDMDDVNWHLSNLDQCLQLPPDWSVCCCNSYKVYYDLWALRVLNESRWIISGQNRDQHPNRMSNRNLGVWNSQKPFRHIPASEAPIRVESCFGGAALYRYNDWNLRMIAESNPYEGLILVHQKQVGHPMRPLCEHVSFHQKLHTNNMSLYIQPKFLNDGPSDERMLYFGAVKKKWQPLYQQSWLDTPEYYRNFFPNPSNGT